MPNIAAVLKAEIARIARKEGKTALTRLHASVSKTRKSSAETRARISELERQVKALAKQIGKHGREGSIDEKSGGASVRMTGKRVRSLRGRLGVTQAELGILVGVSAAAVAQWERQPGALKLRRKAQAGLAHARSLRAREARARLEELVVAQRRRKR